MRAVHQPEDVDLDHPLPLLDRSLLHRAEQHHSGVVHEYVEVTELLDGLLDAGSGRGLIGHVGLEHQRAAPVGLDTAGEVLEPVLAAGDERHCRAVGRQRERRGLADPGTRAGDQSHSAVQCGAVQVSCHGASLPYQARRNRGLSRDAACRLFPAGARDLHEKGVRAA